MDEPRLRLDTPDDVVQAAQEVLRTSFVAYKNTIRQNPESMTERRVQLLVEEQILLAIERNGISCSADDLPDLAGFVISESGHYRLVVASDYPVLERIHFYFRMCGHLALHHLDSSRLSAWYEFRPYKLERVPPDVAAQGYRADKWATAVLAGFLSEHGDEESGYVSTVRLVVMSRATHWSKAHVFIRNVAQPLARRFRLVRLARETSIVNEGIAAFYRSVEKGHELVPSRPRNVRLAVKNGAH